MSNTLLESVVPKIASNGTSKHLEQQVAVKVPPETLSVLSPLVARDFGLTKSRPKLVDNPRSAAIAKELKESETKYRRLFEAAQDGILILDAKTGLVTDVNPCLMQLLDTTREEFLGRALWEVGLFHDAEAFRVTLQELKANQYIHYDDLSLETRDGRSLRVEFVSNVYLVHRKKFIQCNIRDITKRKQAEAAALEPWTQIKSICGQAWAWFAGLFARSSDGDRSRVI